ncbi:MAG: aspartate kinase [Phycisphaerae bacterium]|nr:aspartate kinase [Phycisphaerae bacterium]MDW8261792.1 aspartate kinase [Phycisphaerales bacterium]
MGLIVQKFGGTSVADAARIHRAASRAIAARNAGHEVVVVVSAMGDTTDELIKLAREVCEYGPNRISPPKREMDQLLATGEIITIALLAMAIHAQGHDAISFTGGQIGLVTDYAFTKARIQSINKQRIFEQLRAGKIVIVAGFQGVTPDGDLTTLGRGGSNATLVALGAVLQADVCENYTDVDGIFTADPRIVPNARKIDRISYDEMLELSGLGASVLQTRAVEFAKKYNVPIHVRNSQNDSEGTWITAENKNMEHIVVSGAALKKDLISVTIKEVPDRPGVAARIFSEIAAANIVVDDIIQTVNDHGTAFISFTVEHGDLHDIKPVVERLVREFGGKTQAIYRDDLCKVSVVGVGMRTHTGVAKRMFEALADARINIENITTSEIKISCIIRKEDGNRALQVVHDAFELEKAR